MKTVVYKEKEAPELKTINHSYSYIVLLEEVNGTKNDMYVRSYEKKQILVRSVYVVSCERRPLQETLVLLVYSTGFILLLLLI
jgi:hypothetical protein